MSSRSRPATGSSSAARRSRPAAVSGSRRSTLPRRSRWRRSRELASRTWTRGRRRASSLQARVGPACPAASAPSTCSASPASSQERSRELAVLETLDGGKPIKESRDVDVPLAAAHFWYYAGWADKLEYAVPGPTAASRSASPPRSSPGTSRCSCWPGRSRRPWRRATRSCSSRPAPRRSRRCSSPTSAARRTCRPASSTSSPGPARSASRSSSTPTSTRSPSPARPRSAR